MPLKNTAVLLLITLLLLFPLAVLIGTASALRRRSWVDGFLQGVVLIFASLPSFVCRNRIDHSFLVHVETAACCLAQPFDTEPGPPGHDSRTGLGPTYCPNGPRRCGRVLESDYVQMARLKGIPEGRMIRRHVLPNALVPAIQAFALTAASMPAGIVIVEYLYSFQGIGNMLVQSVENRDADG